MSCISAALALLSGAIGAGFASGREIVGFFAIHGPTAYTAAVCALAALAFFFLRLCAQLEHAGCSTLAALCRIRLGRRLGGLCALLFVLLCAVTGGAMLCACAELGALVLPMRHAYGITMAFSLLAGLVCAHRGVNGLALPGALLTALLPVLLLRLLGIKGGEACFLPAMAPALPIRPAADGMAYGALNAAMLAGMLPSLLSLEASARKKAVVLFTLLFGALLLLGVLVCHSHMAEIYMQPMPFVFLSRALGKNGYLLLSACLYAAAFSTLCAMLLGMQRLLPFAKSNSLALSAVLCLFFARIGFGLLVSRGYPVLGALCAGLLFVLCLPGCPQRQ